MPLNYFILAHKNPKQVVRLIRKLYTKESYFYIHIDKTVDINLFKEDLFFSSQVKFVADENRINMIWGNISIVKATIELINFVILDNRKGHCILLSGQDYPLKSNEFISGFFRKQKDINFITSEEITSQSFDTRGLSRIHHYNFHPYKSSTNNIEIPSVFNKLFYRKRTLKQIFRLLFSKQWHKMYLLFFNREFPKNMTPFGGSQWWALPMETIKIIHSYVEKNPDYLKYHKNTQVPDEIFFHSIILSKILNNKIEPSLTYVKWPKEEEVTSPITFTINDLEELKNSGALFARKFDIDYDESVLDEIDKNL
jgi:hypothetical protein